ncbi:MAG: Gldg family protein [Planctomycetes bacterium]|nr:Gldg family protein [Planctomycetota bacterium]
MSASERRVLLATALVGWLAVLFGVRALDAADAPRVDLEHTGWVRLDPRAERAMRELDSDVVATLVLSGANELPSSERGLERELVELLERLADASAGRFRWQRVEPERSPELADWIAAQGVTPFSLREVRSDAFAERSVFASLVLSYGAHGKRVIHAISRARLGDLPLLVAQELAELVQPSRPRVVLAGAASTRELEAELAKCADVVRVDLAGGEPIPAGTPLVLWIEPERASDAVVAALTRAIDGGTHVVLAGGGLDAQGRPARSREALAAITAQFGARVGGEIVRDDSAVSQSSRAALGSELAVASIASDQDFRLLGSQPNGTLVFRAPSSLLTDASKLVERGSEARVLASSGARAWSEQADRPPGQSPSQSPGAPASESPSEPASAPQRGRQALALHLAPRDGWSGSLIVFGSASPFEDGAFEQVDFAHRNLARALLASLADSARVARVRARAHAAEALPPLSPAERLRWRALVIGLVPLLLFGLALARGSLVSVRATLFGSGPELGLVALLFALFAVGGFAATRLPAPAGIDVTSSRMHTLAPRSLALAAELDRPVTLELFASATLPPRIAATVARVRVLVSDLRGAGADVELVRRLPEALSDAEREALAREGLAARAVETRDETATTVRAVWAALRVSSGSHRSIVDLTSVDGDAVLEFRLVLALERALGRRAPTVALAADTPRLSAAEARELYEALKLFAPSESDVYSQAESWLAENGFDVVRVEPAAPVLADDVDALVWLQPRRDVTPMLATVAAALARGKGAVIAAQHYAIQSRRLDTERGELAHWPRPQYCDLEAGYFAALGIEWVREVLCDASAATLDVATEIGSRRAARALEFSTSARPFVLRALPEGFSATSPIVRGLSDLRLPYANRLRSDPAKLAERGLVAEALVRTSATTWSVAWQGGDLAPGSLVPPETLLGPVDLALDVRGRFPGLDGRPGEREGRAVLVGCSETFKNGQLFDPEWRAADFLLAAVAAVALDDAHAEILSLRPRRAGFVAPDEDERVTWRVLVVLAGPLFVLAFAWALRRAAARPVAGFGA